MNSKIFLVLVICAFFYAPSYASNSFSTRAEKSYHSSSKKGHGHKIKARAEVKANGTAPIAVSRSYGHHEYHHKGYSKHYRERALPTPAEKLPSANATFGKTASATGSDAKAAVVSRKSKHGHHKMRDSYKKGYRKHYRTRALPATDGKKLNGETIASIDYNSDGKNMAAQAVPTLPSGKTTENQTLSAKTGTTGQTVKGPATGASSSQGGSAGTKMRKAEMYYKPEYKEYKPEYHEYIEYKEYKPEYYSYEEEY